MLPVEVHSWWWMWKQNRWRSVAADIENKRRRESSMLFLKLPFWRRILLKGFFIPGWELRGIVRFTLKRKYLCSFKKNRTDNARIIILRRLHEIFLPRKSNKYYTFVPVCSRARARVCACGCPGVWGCVCACVHVVWLIQHARRVRHIVTSFVAPLPSPYFSTLSYKRHDFRKNVLNIKCVFYFHCKFCQKVSQSKNLAR